ncbi:hypothetical protein Dimus_010493 [Dionaea muscipula]
MLDVFIPTKRSRSGSRFDSVRFNNEVAARLAILNADGSKLKDKTLKVKRATFGRSPRMEASLYQEQQEMRKGSLPQFWEGTTDVPINHRCQVGGGFLKTFKDALQGLRLKTFKDALQEPGSKASIGIKRMGCSVPPNVITGESHGVEQLQRSCVIDWSSGNCAGFHALSLFSGMEVGVKVVLLDRLKCLLVFDNDEGFRKVLALDQSWSVSRGLEMTSWSAQLIINPLREVWLKSYRVSLHARCPSTFLAISRQWGEVLSVEFGSLESGFLDEGRIKILSNVVTPLPSAFKLLVNGKEFDCWVVEEGSNTKQEASLILRPRFLLPRNHALELTLFLCDAVIAGGSRLEGRTGCDFDDGGPDDCGPSVCRLEGRAGRGHDNGVV